MTKAQISEASIEDISYFIQNFEEISKMFHMHCDHIINADETLLRGRKDSCTITRIEAKDKSGGSVVMDTKTVGSLTPFVSASGMVWLTVFCLKLPKSVVSKKTI